LPSIVTLLLCQPDESYILLEHEIKKQNTIKEGIIFFISIIFNFMKIRVSLATTLKREPISYSFLIDNYFNINIPAVSNSHILKSSGL
jgi:hypothetical protein